VICVTCGAKVNGQHCIQCSTESVATAAAPHAVSPPVAAAGQGTVCFKRAVTCWPWACASPALEASDQPRSGESHAVYAQTGSGESTGVVARTVYGNTGEEKKCLPWASASHALEAYDQAGGSPPVGSGGEPHAVYAQTGSRESTGVVARVWKESMRWHEPALRELLQGAKSGHWIWHVFPTHVRHAAGSKPDSAMRSLAEAREYLSQTQLRRNYLEVSCGTGYFIGGAGTAYTNKRARARSCAHAHTHINSRHA
jgi:hypothetical protein